MQKTKGSFVGRKESGQPSDLLQALRPAVNLLFYGVLVFLFCRWQMSKVSKNKEDVWRPPMSLHQEPSYKNEEQRQQQQTSSHRKDKQQKEPMFDQKPSTSGFENKEILAGQLSVHEIKHMVPLKHRTPLFIFPEGFGRYDVGFILTPYFLTSHHSSKWSPVQCKDGVVMLKLVAGLNENAFVVSEHVLKYRERTTVLWKNMIAVTNYNVRNIVPFRVIPAKALTFFF